MSTLEKFGILVILILVVIIGVVAVWGVGGEGDNPFANEPAGDAVAVADPAAPPNPQAWPDGGTPPAGNNVAPGPVPAPGLGAQPTPANGGGAAGPAPAPSNPGFTSYTVLPGDTGAGIAKKTGVAWKDIAAANNNKDPRKLKIKEVLRIPSGGTAVADMGAKPPLPNNSLLGEPVNRNDLHVAPPVNPADGPTDMNRGSGAPAPDAGREVEVRSGDTLYEIARRELGDPNLFYRIQKANPGLDPKKLRPGMKIKVPAK